MIVIGADVHKSTHALGLSIGCGPLCAAILIGQTAGAERFRTDAHFARVAGVAPIPVSSGRQDRHRLDRGGNRQLNRALHIIAITRGRIDPETRAYSPARKPRARAGSRRCAASSDISHATNTASSVRRLLTPTHPPGFISGGAPTRLACPT